MHPSKSGQFCAASQHRRGWRPTSACAPSKTETVGDTKRASATPQQELRCVFVAFLDVEDRRDSTSPRSCAG